MGMQDRDYYREWWSTRESVRQKSEPVHSQPALVQQRSPDPLWPFVAWAVLLCVGFALLVLLGNVALLLLR